MVTVLMVAGAVGAVFTGFARRRGENRLQLRAESFLSGALFLAFAWNIGVRNGLFTNRAGVPSRWMEGLLGLTLISCAGLSALWASRFRARGELLLSSAPTALDDAVRRLGEGMKSYVGVFAGRLGASNEVASPGGVVCGFYDAEIRSVSPSGERGALVSVDRGFSSVLYVRGECVQAQLEFSASELLAPVTIRRCTVGGQLGVDLGGDLNPAEGTGDLPEVPTNALSYERVGKLGEPCLVVGKLERTGVPGRYRLAGFHHGPALVAMGAEAVAAGRLLMRRSRACLGLAVGCVMAAAYLLDRV